MKKSIIAIALLGAGFCAAPVFAQDFDAASQPASTGNYLPSQAVGSGNWFINGNVGYGHVNQGPYNDHPTTYAINGGYRWKVGQDLGVGLEVGYNDMGNYKLKNTFQSGNVNQKSMENELRGWTAGVNARFNVTPKWYLSAHGGVYSWRGQGYTNQGINRHKLDEVDYFAGVGAGYDFNDHLSLGVAYDYYHAGKDGVKLSTDTASVNMEYRF